MEIEKSIFFFMLEPISRHNSKTLHVFRILDFDLEPAQIFENVPSPVLAKSPTGIGQFANRYWPIRQPVLIKSYAISCPDFLIFEIISQFKTKTLSLEQNS